jgi:hypothetical protein
MSRSAMEIAISEVPSSSRTLSNLSQHLLNISEKVDEGIAGILVAASDSGDRLALVVTEARIIEVTPSGAVQAWRYADMSSLSVNGGRKKLIGRESLFLNIRLSRASGELNWLLIYTNEYCDHNMRVGKVAENACQEAQINKL